MEQSTETKPKLLTIAQVAKELNLSRTQVYKLVATEGLPAISFGRALRVRPAALDQWLVRREQERSA